MEKINAAKQAIAAEKAKAVQASESQQAQLRITELETQEKVHATSIKVSHAIPWVKQYSLEDLLLLFCALASSS